MLIGIPKEIKDHEYRVALTPDSVAALLAAGHQVRVQTGAAARIGFPDDAYRAAGAQIVDNAATVYEAELIVKAKRAAKRRNLSAPRRADGIQLSAPGRRA